MASGDAPVQIHLARGAKLVAGCGGACCFEDPSNCGDACCFEDPSVPWYILTAIPRLERGTGKTTVIVTA
jgi:hypothetical protein